MGLKTVLITGANGEVGHGLIHHFLKTSSVKIVAVDLKPLDKSLASPNITSLSGDILDTGLNSELTNNFEFDAIFHLAALLSTSSERDPLRAHRVNVDGSINILEIARAQSERRGVSTRVIFPSTVAVYGLSAEEHARNSKVGEAEFLSPVTIYGANKLYVERLGIYYSNYFNSLGDSDTKTKIDFRAVRFPGLISSETMPTGGTSDYGAEILHAAVKNSHYDCFVTPEATLPFMVMPDAVRALVELEAVPLSSLRQRVYNLTAFSVSASQIFSEVKKYFPSASIAYKPQAKRLGIVESWPKDINDAAARRDWGWKPAFDFSASFEHYLVPGVLKQYGIASGQPRKACC